MSQGNFIATDISIAQTSAALDGTSFDAIPLEVEDQNKVRIQLKATGDDSGCSNSVTAKFVGTIDGVKWDTEQFSSAAVTLDGVNSVAATVLMDVRGFHSIKPAAISNADASSADNVNVKWGKPLP